MLDARPRLEAELLQRNYGGRLSHTLVASSSWLGEYPRILVDLLAQASEGAPVLRDRGSRLFLGLGFVFSIGLAVTFGVFVNTKPVIAVVAGTATAALVLGFELLRQIEGDKLRRDELFPIMEIVSERSDVELQSLIVICKEVSEASASLTAQERTDLLDMLSALLATQHDRIPIFATEALRAFKELGAHLGVPDA